MKLQKRMQIIASRDNQLSFKEGFSSHKGRTAIGTSAGGNTAGEFN
jgi:hypothetical protein